MAKKERIRAKKGKWDLIENYLGTYSINTKGQEYTLEESKQKVKSTLKVFLTNYFFKFGPFPASFSHLFFINFQTQFNIIL
jgi:hypothetical protein